MEEHFGRGQMVFLSTNGNFIAASSYYKKKNYIIHINIKSTFKCLSFVKTVTWLVVKHTILILIISSSSRLICRFLHPSNLYPCYFRTVMERWLLEAYLRRVLNIWYYGLGVGCLFGGGRLFKEISLQIMLLFVYTTTRKSFLILTCKYFKLSWNITAQSQSNCRNFSCSRIILLIYSWWWQWNNFVL